jgi:hypothetical protein
MNETYNLGPVSLALLNRLNELASKAQLSCPLGRAAALLNRKVNAGMSHVLWRGNSKSEYRLTEDEALTLALASVRRLTAQKWLSQLQCGWGVTVWFNFDPKQYKAHKERRNQYRCQIRAYMKAVHPESYAEDLLRRREAARRKRAVAGWTQVQA